MANDVIAVVSRNAMPKQKDSLDILLVGTTGEYPVNTYRDVASVEAVFGDNGECPNAKIVRKATTLFNQGKTTLAETLVNKFKIVSFDPPTTSPATNAKLTVTVSEENEIEAGDLYIKIGGDDKAVIHITLDEVVTNEELAVMLDGKTFMKNDMTFTGVTDGNAVTFTADNGGKIDTIPKLISVYRNNKLSDVANIAMTVEFANGIDAKSAPDNLVARLQEFQEIDNDWYFLMSDRDEEEYVKALAKFAEMSEPTEAELGAGIEDHSKVYMGQTSNKDFESNTARSAVVYADKEALKEEVDASYVGNVAPFYPQSVTWKFKKPQNGNKSTGETISIPKLTRAEKDKLTENNVNIMTEEYKHTYMKNGTCLNGEFIDVVLGSDWIKKRMRELCYEILLNNPSITYDDAGFGLISTAVMQALAEATDLNIIQRDAETKAGKFTVNVPKYSESTLEQRSNRVMPNIEWEALLAGAVHSVKTKGVLKASL